MGNAARLSQHFLADEGAVSTIVAAAGSASVSAGSARCESTAPRFSKSPVMSESITMKPVISSGPKPAMRPLSGATDQCIEKRNWSSIASQKLATARPETVRTRST